MFVLCESGVGTPQRMNQQLSRELYIRTIAKSNYKFHGFWPIQRWILFIFGPGCFIEELGHKLSQIGRVEK